MRAPSSGHRCWPTWTVTKSWSPRPTSTVSGTSILMRCSPTKAPASCGRSLTPATVDGDRRDHGVADLVAAVLDREVELELARALRRQREADPLVALRLDGHRLLALVHHAPSRVQRLVGVVVQHRRDLEAVADRREARDHRHHHHRTAHRELALGADALAGLVDDDRHHAEARQVVGQVKVAVARPLLSVRRSGFQYAVWTKFLRALLVVALPSPAPSPAVWLCSSRAARRSRVSLTLKRSGCPGRSAVGGVGGVEVGHAKDALVDDRERDLGAGDGLASVLDVDGDGHLLAGLVGGPVAAHVGAEADVVHRDGEADRADLPVGALLAAADRQQRDRSRARAARGRRGSGPRTPWRPRRGGRPDD
jgi:hypothetical protein